MYVLVIIVIIISISIIIVRIIIIIIIPPIIGNVLYYEDWRLITTITHSTITYYVTTTS